MAAREGGSVKNEYEVRGDVTAIFLRRADGTRLETLIDTADFMLVASHPGTWKAHFNEDTGGYYVDSNVGKSPHRTVLMLHRLLTDAPTGLVVDHINHDTLDNRRKNLRVASASVNALNRRLARNNKSGVTGVHWHIASQRWIARVKVGQRVVYDATFASFDDAVTAREREFERAFAVALSECGAA